MAHTSICDACDVVVEHRTEVDADDWAFAHAMEVHNTILDEVDVIEVAGGGTETFIWPRLLPLDVESDKEAMVRISRRASTTLYAFMKKVRPT